MVIRRVTPQDFEAVYQFLNELQGRVFNRETIKELYLKNIVNPSNIYLIALEDTSPLGYLSCHVQPLLHHAGKVAEIQEMFVRSEYRNKGLGKLLMDELKGIIKREGVLQLEVTTRVIRENAIEFYKRESFEDSHKKLVFYF